MTNYNLYFGLKNLYPVDNISNLCCGNSQIDQNKPNRLVFKAGWNINQALNFFFHFAHMF